MGKKTIDLATQRDVSRGRKSKAGGGEESKATQMTQLYTPLLEIKADVFTLGLYVLFVTKHSQTIYHRNKAKLYPVSAPHLMKNSSMNVLNEWVNE